MRCLMMPLMLMSTAACATGTGSSAELNQTAPAPAQDHSAHGGQHAAPAPTDGIRTCDLAKVQGHIGHAFQPAMGEQIRTQAAASTVRVLRPGDAATMDYRSDRLNIDLDASGRISAIRCG